MEVRHEYREDLTTANTTTAAAAAAAAAGNSDHVQRWLSALQQGNGMRGHWNNGTSLVATGNPTTAATSHLGTSYLDTPHLDTPHLQSANRNLQHRKRKQSASDGFTPATNNHCVEGHVDVRANDVTMTPTEREAGAGARRASGPGTPLWPRGVVSAVWPPLSRACPCSPASPHWPRAFPFPPPPHAVQAALAGAGDLQCVAPESPPLLHSPRQHHTASFGPTEQYTGSLGLTEHCTVSFCPTESCTGSLGSAEHCPGSHGYTDSCTGSHGSTEQCALSYGLTESCTGSLGSEHCALPLGSTDICIEALGSASLDRTSNSFAGSQCRRPLQPWRRQDSAEDSSSLSSWGSTCASGGGNSCDHAHTRSGDSTCQSSDCGHAYTLPGVSSCQSSVSDHAYILPNCYPRDWSRSHDLLEESTWQRCDCSHAYALRSNAVSTCQFNSRSHAQKTVPRAERRSPAARWPRPSVQLSAQLSPYPDSDTGLEDMWEAKAGHDQEAWPSHVSQFREWKGRGLKGPRIEKGRTSDDWRGLRPSQRQRQATPLGPAGTLRQRVNEARVQILNDIRKRRPNSKEQPMTARAGKAGCKFCKKNGEDGEVVSHHSLYDKEGRVQCPILRVFRCELCQATGDHAHTITYCPLKPLLSFDDSVALRRKMHQQNQRRLPR